MIALQMCQLLLFLDFDTEALELIRFHSFFGPVNPIVVLTPKYPF